MGSRGNGNGFDPRASGGWPADRVVGPRLVRGGPRLVHKTGEIRREIAIANKLSIDAETQMLQGSLRFPKRR